MEKTKKKIHPAIIVVAGVVGAFLLVVVVSSIFNRVFNGSGSTKASSKAISVAKQAVEVADAYLDGKTTGTQANRKMDDFYEQMKYVDDQNFEDENHAGDFLIQASVLCLRTSISRDAYKSTADTYKDVLEARNELAKTAGIKRRK